MYAWLQAMLILLVSIPFALFTLLWGLRMARRLADRPLTGGQCRLAWRCLPAISLALLAGCAWVYSALAHSLTHWHTASWAAFLLAYASFALWYERQVLALGDQD